MYSNEEQKFTTEEEIEEHFHRILEKVSDGKPMTGMNQIIWRPDTPEETVIRAQRQAAINQLRVKKMEESPMFSGNIDAMPTAKDIPDIVNPYESLKEAITPEVLNAMLQSPMFANNDGYTAMNDLGLSQSADGPAPMNDDGHVGGWGAMFQEPLQPFSF